MAGKFEIKAVVTGAQQSSEEIKKIGDATQQTGKKIEDLGRTTEKTSAIKGKFLDGVKKARIEIPLLGTVVDAVKNPFNLLGVAIALVATKAIEAWNAVKPLVSSLDHAKAPVTNAGEAFKTTAEGVAALAAAMKDLHSFTDSVVTGMQRQIEKLDEQFAATEKLLGAEAELAKLKIDRDERDPVKAAAAKAAIDENLALQKLGLSGKKGQQAAIIDQQIARERDLQVEAGAAVPRREDLVASVTAYQEAKQQETLALKTNRSVFAQAEILRRAAEENPDWSQFSEADLGFLKQVGITSPNHDTGGLRFDRERATGLLAAQTPIVQLSRERLASARANLNLTRGRLPAGVSSFSDIDPFIDSANAEAAAVQNQSYGREGQLTLRRNSLLEGQQQDINLGRIAFQAASVKGDTAVQRALEEQAKTFAEGTKANTQLLQSLMAEIATLKRAQASQAHQ